MNPLDYLSDDNILIVSKPLAKAVGIGQAILLRRLHFWMGYYQKVGDRDEAVQKKHFHDGRWWIWNSYPEWAEDVEIYHEDTIQRYFRELEDLGLAMSCDDYNTKGFDKTKWYTIDYAVYEWFMQTWVECGKPMVNGGRPSAERRAFLDFWTECRTNAPSPQIAVTSTADCGDDDRRLPPPIPVSPTVSPTVPLTGRAATSGETPTAKLKTIHDLPANMIFGDEEDQHESSKPKPLTRHDDVNGHELVLLLNELTGVQRLNKDMLKVLVGPHRIPTEDGITLIPNGLIGLWDKTPGFANFCRQRIPELLAMDGVDMQPLAILQHLRKLNKVKDTPHSKEGFWLWRENNESLWRNIPGDNGNTVTRRTAEEEAALSEARFGIQEAD